MNKDKKLDNLTEQISINTDDESLASFLEKGGNLFSSDDDKSIELPQVVNIGKGLENNL